MKKQLAALLAFLLLLTLAACGGAETAPAGKPGTEAPADGAAADGPSEGGGDPDDADDPDDASADPEPDVTGRWYCALGTTELCLELEAGGAYTVSLPHDPEETAAGTWETRDGYLYLDGDETAPLSTDGTLLFWPAAGVFLSREEPEPLYVPAATLEKLPEGILDGYWVAAFLELDGEIFSVDDLDEKMDLYVEGGRAALGGPVFADQIVELELREDGLCFAGEGFRVDMKLQADGYMRLSLSVEGEGELVYYLFNATPVDETEIEEG